MGGATRSYFLHVLDESLSVVASAGAEHLVIGGLATRALLGDGIDPAEDVDLLVKQERRAAAGRVLRAGYATYRRDEG